MEQYDVVILGTGAAGLTAAVVAHEGGARVGVFEKADLIGGTTAWSGGQVWIPNNPHMPEVGIEDSREHAITYIMSLSHGLIDQKLAETFVDTGPDMVRFLESRTPVQFYSVAGMPDYHPEFPGGSIKGGRTIECPIFPYDELGAWEKRVTPSPYYVSGNITMSETPLGSALPKIPSEEELKRRAIRNERGCGQALIGRLLKACLDRGIEPKTSHRAVELLTENGRITGVRFETESGPVEVGAKRGVVLATGGFEWNPDYVRAFLRGPMTHPVSVKTNTGDGLKMAMKAGAMLGNMREAWWMPAATVPKEESTMERQMISGQRTMPRSIMVNKKGQRFTNEAANYNAFGNAFHQFDVPTFSYANLPCWLIFDQGYVENYGFGGRFGTPGAISDWVTRADSLPELAALLKIPPANLAETVARWNQNVAAGSDPDHLRGESAFDRWWGDPNRKGRKDATLGPLDKPPYYAVEIHSGALGTKGGPKIDSDARVIGIEGEPIPGLYAAGNVMASPFGMTYGGPGGTLGPGMVFGYLAGRHAAGHVANR
jgi:succinate dehydrogenase/fumarate reductase flavoprotein subunit